MGGCLEQASTNLTRGVPRELCWGRRRCCWLSGGAAWRRMLVSQWRTQCELGERRFGGTRSQFAATATRAWGCSSP